MFLFVIECPAFDEMMQMCPEGQDGFNVDELLECLSKDDASQIKENFDKIYLHKSNTVSIAEIRKAMKCDWYN